MEGNRLCNNPCWGPWNACCSSRDQCWIWHIRCQSRIPWDWPCSNGHGWPGMRRLWMIICNVMWLWTNSGDVTWLDTRMAVVMVVVSELATILQKNLWARRHFVNSLRVSSHFIKSLWAGSHLVTRLGYRDYRTERCWKSNCKGKFTKLQDKVNNLCQGPTRVFFW